MAFQKPLLVPPPLPPRREVQAALDAEITYLVQSGELQDIFNVYRDPNAREGAIDKLLRERLAKRLPKEFTGLEVHVQPGLVSFRFVSHERRDQIEPAAHARIPTRLLLEE